MFNVALVIRFLLVLATGRSLRQRIPDSQDALGCDVYVCCQQGWVLCVRRRAARPVMRNRMRGIIVDNNKGFKGSFGPSEG